MATPVFFVFHCWTSGIQLFTFKNTAVAVPAFPQVLASLGIFFSVSGPPKCLKKKQDP